MKKMNLDNSTLTFKDLTKHLNYIKVIWNDKKIYDDDEINSYQDFLDFERKIKDKIIYSMNIIVVEFHHCILVIQGEEV